MAIVSALVFASALALIATVMAGTLLPSWERIVMVLAGQPLRQPQVATVRRHRLRTDRRVAHLAARLREAA